MAEARETANLDADDAKAPEALSLAEKLLTASSKRAGFEFSNDFKRCKHFLRSQELLTSAPQAFGASKLANYIDFLVDFDAEKARSPSPRRLITFRNLQII